MQKNTTQNAMTGLVNGSMAVARKAAKVKGVMRRRHFMEKVATLSPSSQVLSQSQSLYPVGSQFSTATLLFAANQLSTNAISWIQSNDKYRITEVEVFATLTSESTTGRVEKSTPVELYFYEDTDADPSTLTSWIRVQDRDNLGKAVLTALNPTQRLITFKPTVTLAASSGGAQSPSNFVPAKGSWLDALAIDQLHSGVRLFTACAQTDAQGQSYRYSVQLSARYTVEATQPI